MKNITRRSFIKTTAAVSIPASFASFSSVQASTPRPQPKRVIVIGGGFGGAGCAKYLKRFDSKIDVTLIEPKTTYMTCPGSNWYLSGFKTKEDITHDYKMLESKHNVDVIHKMVTGIDAAKKTVTLGDGDILKYDRLVVSTGIDFKYSAIEGYSKEVAQKIPHSYQAGPQTTLLYNQLRKMKQGGTFVISAPKNPYRCPPGPYERVSMIAEYFKDHNPTAKIIILDSKKKFPKQKEFEEGWGILYGDMIKWVSAKKGGHVTKVDPKTMTVYSKYKNIKADVINLIPPQKAAALAFSAGLTNKKGWCPVNAKTFESKIHKDIHVIGDSCFVGQMPKSAHSAVLQAKTCAAVIVSDFNNFTPPTVRNAIACYSLVGEHYGVGVVAAFKLKNDMYIRIKEATGVAAPAGTPLAFRRQEAAYAKGWYKSITADVWKS